MTSAPSVRSSGEIIYEDTWEGEDDKEWTRLVNDGIILTLDDQILLPYSVMGISNLNLGGVQSSFLAKGSVWL